MKLKVQVKRLKEVVDRAYVAVSKNNQNQQLKGIYFEAKENSLTVRATNISVGYQKVLSAEVEAEGAVLILGDVISRVLGSVTFSENAYCEMVLEGNVCKLEVGKHAFSLKTLPHENFPTLPTVEGVQFEIDTHLFVQGLKHAVYAVAKTDIKPEISGVYTYVEDGSVVFVGTDSYRLAEKKFNNKQLPNCSFILPEKNTKDFIRLYDGAITSGKLSLSKNSLSFELEDEIFVTRLIQGNFPNYRQIIPSSPETQVVFLKSDIQKVLKIVSFFSDKTEQVILSASENKISLNAENVDIGSASEEIQATLKGEPFSIKINSRYFEEFLNTTNDTSIILKFTAQNKPIIIQGIEDAFYTYLVMPSYK
jgi:DNA polymerase-3 subunit beta